jgi:hypothetical protein
MLSDIPAFAITLLFLANCLFLFRRWRRKKDSMIIASGILPRLLFGLAYLAFALGEAGIIDPVMIELRGSIVRSFLVGWLVLEVLNHMVVAKRGKL